MTLPRLDVYRFMETSHVTQRQLLRKYIPGALDAEVNSEGAELGRALRLVLSAGNWAPMMVEVREWHHQMYGERSRA